MESETGALRAVLVHSPDGELNTLTPDDHAEFLFDELVWPQRAREEHEAFTTVLRSRGVAVLDLREGLAEVCRDKEVGRRLAAQAMAGARVPPRARDEVISWLAELPAEMLVRSLLGGISSDEVPRWVPGTGSLWRHRPWRLLDPLPNQMFTRDSSAWFRDGYLLGRMRSGARAREVDLVAALYRHHPWFAGHAERCWNEALPPSMPIEGGDLLVLSGRALAVGVGDRTCAAAVEALAEELFARELCDRLVVVDLPRTRATIHLDTLVSFVDEDAVVMSPELGGRPVCTLRPGRGGPVLRHQPDFATAAGEALGSALRVLEPGRDGGNHRREQWDDGCNVLAVAPGEVIAYESNELTNDHLERHGIGVHRIPGSELRRARGGPRCLSCPLHRDS
ncbi:arginine deiminase [Amycolatopsis magusensis]|uniref:Arginine deiminase n=1 Tax=Amycolatopsis magusensis TaxID=882444 RepID=A0ABS4PZR3_9PSEU|nr:arginine deiminase family protein [Amycolatopsis magusensis]MBP2184400.1 arginine deiminase [Amycolatopsis magusensis]